MVHKTLKIYIISIGSALAITVAFLVGFYIIEHSGSDVYLKLEFIEESYLDDFNRGYVNLTFTDLSPYPTLWGAIQQLLDPTSNLTRISVGISSEEEHSIKDELLRDSENRLLMFFAYYEYHFLIMFYA